VNALRVVSGRLGRVVPPLLVAVLVLVVGAVVVLGKPAVRRVTAHFTAAVGIYPGSDVRMLGVKVGEITLVRPEGRTVRIEMAVEAKHKVPADAIAVIVPPSVVSDRYVQLAPTYRGGPRLRDGADIPITRTAAPLELDDIYRSLNDLNVALGPNGANADGALARLLKVGRENLQGQGGNLNTALRNYSKAVQTLSEGRQDLFSMIVNLQQFTTALAESDAQVRRFNVQMASVSEQLEAEKEELAAALRSLSIALGQVASFVRENRDVLVSNVEALTRITAILVKQKEALAQILDEAPLALSNLDLAYNPSSGTLDTRDNASAGADPALTVCAVLAAAGKLGVPSDLKTACGQLVNAIHSCDPSMVPAPLGPLLGKFPPLPVTCPGGSSSSSSSSSSSPAARSGAPAPSAPSAGAPAPKAALPGGDAGAADSTLGGVLKARRSG